MELLDLLRQVAAASRVVAVTGTDRAGLCSEEEAEVNVGSNVPQTRVVGSIGSRKGKRWKSVSRV
jgi:hypothetical protein